MKSFVYSLLGGFGALVINKSIVEPVARKIGQNLLSLYVAPCCKRLDQMFLGAGIAFSPEMVVRDYLDLEPEGLSPQDVDRIVAEVFRVYDVRLIK
ncbi:MAG: hypothetical protein CMH53_04490 [Myxococcales bacterium]|nr:hypothetical protein [Myxococcales bacterium]